MKINKIKEEINFFRNKFLNNEYYRIEDGEKYRVINIGYAGEGIYETSIFIVYERLENPEFPLISCAYDFEKFFQLEPVEIPEIKVMVPVKSTKEFVGKIGYPV